MFLFLLVITSTIALFCEKTSEDNQTIYFKSTQNTCDGLGEGYMNHNQEGNGVNALTILDTSRYDKMVVHCETPDEMCVSVQFGNVFSKAFIGNYLEMNYYGNFIQIYFSYKISHFKLKWIFYE